MISLNAFRLRESIVLTFDSSVSRISATSLVEYPSMSLRWSVILCFSGRRAIALCISCCSFHLSGFLSSRTSGIFGVVSRLRRMRSIHAFLTDLVRKASMFPISRTCFRRILSATSCIISSASSLRPRMLQASLNMKSSLFCTNISFPLNPISVNMTHKCTKRVTEMRFFEDFTDAGRGGGRSRERLSSGGRRCLTVCVRKEPMPCRSQRNTHRSGDRMLWPPFVSR